jgi:hypothetical protein
MDPAVIALTTIGLNAIRADEGSGHRPARRGVHESRSVRRLLAAALRAAADALDPGRALRPDRRSTWGCRPRAPADLRAGRTGAARAGDAARRLRDET